MGAKILASALQRCQFLLFTYDLRCMNTINIVGATYGWMTKPWRVSSDYLCLMELLVSLLQKRHPLPLSPQNYPLHGSEVNGFHSAPTTYNHTPTINGEGIMGKEKSTYHTSIFVVSVRFSSHGHLIYFCFVFFFFSSQKQINGSSDSRYLFCLCSQPRHHSWQFRRWNRKGSCLSEFFSVCCWFFKLELGNKTITVIFLRVFMLFIFLCWTIRVKKKQISVNSTKVGDADKNVPSVVWSALI